MKITTKGLNLERIKADAYLLACFEDKKLLEESFNFLETNTGKPVDGLIKDDFKGKNSQLKSFYHAGRRFILTGLGKRKLCTLEILRCSTARAMKAADSNGNKSVALFLYDGELIDYSFEEIITGQVEASLLSLYKFNKYIHNKKDTPKDQINEIIFLTSQAKKRNVEKHINTAVIIAESNINARDLGNEPSNIATPQYVAGVINSYGKKYGFNVKTFDKKALVKMKMGCLLAVAQGSANEPRMVVMTYNGGKKGQKPYAIVGKGVTFDTGGISIKPSQGMESMKMDMNGAAAVIGTMNAVARLKLKVNLIGIVGLTENMPGGSAYKPGDIITSYDGKTVEVLNTDAEGRLVLADCVSYATEFKPKCIIDLATLTGAALIALGHTSTALISNNDELSEKLIKAGNDTFERLWRLPDWDDYDRLIDSEVADVANIGQGRLAGTITGALFIKRFVKDYPWAHLDIAGTGMSPKAGDYVPKFSTGVGVRLLTRMFKDSQ